MKSRRMNQQETIERLERRIDQLDGMIKQIDPTTQQYDNLDQLMQQIKGIHQSALAQIEAAFKQYKEQRFWKYKEKSE